MAAVVDWHANNKMSLSSPHGLQVLAPPEHGPLAEYAAALVARSPVSLLAPATAFGSPEARWSGVAGSAVALQAR